MLFHSDTFSIITKDYKSVFQGDVFIAPNIPDKKLNGSIKEIAKNTITPNKVLLVHDQTIFGSATNGILATIDTFYYKGFLSEQYNFKYIDIIDVFYKKNVKKDDKGKETVTEKLIIIAKDQPVELSSYHSLSLEALRFWLLALRDAAKNQESESKIERRALEDMPIEIQMAYLKIIINFLLSDDEVIDEKELGQLYSLITRLKISITNRHDLLLYQTNKEDTETLTEIMCNSLDELAQQEIIYSLAKDLINIHMQTKGNDYNSSSFIMEFAKRNKITNDQLELFITAINNDNKIYDDNIDDKGLEKGFTAIATSAATVGVPLAALYFSGSVIGLGAAGITSGLSALGLGGLFGLSGMVTGIGAVVLIGVGANKGIKYLTGQSEIEKRKRKEALLLAVNKHLQKAINTIMEDINFIMGELAEEYNKSILLGEKVKQSEEKIQKLVYSLKAMAGGGQQLSITSQHAELQALLQRLPRILNIEKLQTITSEPTQKIYYQNILNYFREEETKNEEGKIIKQYVLIDNLSRDEANYLVNILNELGYFSASTLAKQGLSSITNLFGK